MLAYIKAEDKVLAPHDVEYLFSQSDVQELLSFIISSFEAPILRTIKAEFADWDQRYLSEMIDLLISKGYIERSNRRYYATVPMLYEESINRVQLDVERLHFKWDMTMSQLKKKWQLIAEKYGIDSIEVFNQHMQLYLHGVMEQRLQIERPALIDIDADVPWLSEAKVMLNDAKVGQYHYLGVSSLRQQEPHFHDYFLAVNRGMTQDNPLFARLYAQTGDVNGAYFMEQSARKLKRAKRHGELVEDSFNLFTNTLKQLDYLDGHQLNCQVYSKKQFPIWEECLVEAEEIITSTVKRLAELSERVEVPLLPYWLFMHITTSQLDDQWMKHWLVIEG